MGGKQESILDQTIISFCGVVVAAAVVVIVIAVVVVVVICYYLVAVLRDVVML